jgi:hypothetical protein
MEKWDGGWDADSVGGDGGGNLVVEGEGFLICLQWEVREEFRTAGAERSLELLWDGELLDGLQKERT